MLKATLSFLVSLGLASPLLAQSVSFQSGANGYTGTVDTEFRAAAPTDPQGDKEFLSIDQFDGGFQTQGAIRFENIFGGATGIPNGATILFAEIEVWVDSVTDASAVISFNRVLGPDQNREQGSGVWGNDDTWFSLGGDLFPNEGGLLMGDPILLSANVDPSDPNFDVAEAQSAPESTNANGVPRGVLPPEFNEVGDALVSIDVTDSLQLWAAAGSSAASNAANFGWSINNTTGNGWDIFTSEFGTADPTGAQAFAEGEGFASFVDLRPKLTVVFAGAAGQGDLNFDGFVDLQDYNLLLGNLAIELDGAIDAGFTGDLDFDRDVDLTDFNIFKDLFPGGAVGLQAAISAQSVPEPATVWLAAAAIGGVVVMRRRR